MILSWRIVQHADKYIISYNINIHTCICLWWLSLSHTFNQMTDLLLMVLITKFILFHTKQNLDALYMTVFQLFLGLTATCSMEWFLIVVPLQDKVVQFYNTFLNQILYLQTLIPSWFHLSVFQVHFVVHELVSI